MAEYEQEGQGSENAWTKKEVKTVARRRASGSDWGRTIGIVLKTGHKAFKPPKKKKRKPRGISKEEYARLKYISKLQAKVIREERKAKKKRKKRRPEITSYGGISRGKSIYN